MSTNDKLVPGMVLGRYELLVPIAQGGMATVWAARQKGSRGFQKTVAIKTMLPSLSDDPKFEQMFLDEAALAAKIHHPNVAEILDLGEQDEILYLVMEWVDGEALSVLQKAARKNQTQLPLRIVLRVAVQACAGLHAAHELHDENEVPLQLVHRDVSPQNIMVTYDGIAKLVDFGVAKAVGRASAETSAGQIKGKVPYMSPEQARGGQIDRRTDIFAMGIVLYKLTTGLHPFLGENDLLTMRNIISRPLLPPRVKNPSFPKELEQILMKCLQKDPDKRYQTMLELGTTIERALITMGVGDDDVGGFIRSVVGERGVKRRAQIRDAARMADERFTSGTRPAPVATAPQLHEGVSEIVLTKVDSSAEVSPERASLITGPQRSSSSSISAVSPPPVMTEPISIPEIAGLRRRRTNIYVGIGIVAVALIATAAIFLRSTTSTGLTSAASVHAAVVAPPSSSSTNTQPESSNTPPLATPPSTSVSALAPSAEPLEKDTKPKRLSVPVHGRSPPPNPNTKTTRPVTTHWVPSVQNPGF